MRIKDCYFEEVLGGEAIDLDDTGSYSYVIRNNHIDMTAHSNTGEGDSLQRSRTSDSWQLYYWSKFRTQIRFSY